MDAKKEKKLRIFLVVILVITIAAITVLLTPVIWHDDYRDGITATNHTWTQKELIIYFDAQVYFKRITGKYAKSLSEFKLRDDTKGLLTGSLHQARTPESATYGYYFVDILTDKPDGFGLCAVPAEYGYQGRRIFIVNQEGSVYCKDFGRSVEIIEWPKDPKKEGWEKTFSCDVPQENAKPESGSTWGLH